MKKMLFLILSCALLLSACAQVPQTTAAQAGQGTETPIPPVKASDEIIAEARLVPLDSVTLSFVTSGVVKEVNFEEGDLVNDGDVIARLGNQEQLMASVAAAELELLNAQQALKTLQEGGELALAEVTLDVANAQKELEDANKERNSLAPGNRASAETIDETKRQLNEAQKTYNDAQSYYNSLSDIPEDDPRRSAAYANLAEARSLYWTYLTRYNWYTGKPTETDQAVLDAKVALAETRLAEAQKRQEGLQNGVDPDDIALAEARIVNAQAQLAAAKATLDDLVLISPFTGTVLSIDLKAGQFVGAASPSVKLVDFSSWKIETTDLTELSVVRIRPGDVASIKFDALPEVTFSGTVEKIKPLGENMQGDIVYTVVIMPDEDETWQTWKEQLRWNMTAAITIKPQKP
ncbi:MAG: efflux RND transporter periplasmic adaptor subunit [Chloroflexota bacterium]